MDINELRGDIDRIDLEIVSLFERRMRTASEIGRYKCANNRPLFDPVREAELVKSRVGRLENAELAPFLECFLGNLMDISKYYQYRVTHGKNIVLIGMMGSGKTAKGRIIADNLCMDFIDIDSEIEAVFGEAVSDIFAKYGEEKFRKAEAEQVAKAAACGNAVISTGGGVVLNELNMKLLKASGVVVFMNRDIDKIAGTVDTQSRPLLDSTDKIYEIYKQRLSLYQRWSDVEISGEFDDVGQAADKIINTIFTSG